MQETKTYKGIDLLDKIFEFTEMTPNANQWTVSALKTNLPRQIRLKQIHSLIKAFFPPNLPNNFIDKTKQLFSDTKIETIQTILFGEFLLRKNTEEFTELLKFIVKTVEEENFKRDERKILNRDLIMPYQQLLKYKRQLRNLITFNSGWQEGSSITSRFSIYLTNSISMNLVDKYSELDKALELFINPKNLSFTEKELIEKYNFPKDNLYEIDMDNW